MMIGNLSIIISFCIAIISLFLPWATAFTAKNGFQIQGYILLVFFIYPFVASIIGKNIIKFISLPLSVIGIIASFSIMNWIKTQGFNEPAIGVYIMIGSCVLLLVGSLLHKNTSVATENIGYSEKKSSQQSQDMYDNGECPNCSAKIEKSTVRCQECQENLFDYAQASYKLK